MITFERIIKDYPTMINYDTQTGVIDIVAMAQFYTQSRGTT